MSEDEARRHIAKWIKTAIEIGDVSIEFAQADGGLEINSVGDGVGVGLTYPDSIGMRFFRSFNPKETKRDTWRFESILNAAATR